MQQAAKNFNPCKSIFCCSTSTKSLPALFNKTCKKWRQMMLCCFSRHLPAFLAWLSPPRSSGGEEGCRSEWSSLLDVEDSWKDWERPAGWPFLSTSGKPKWSSVFPLFSTPLSGSAGYRLRRFGSRTRYALLASWMCRNHLKICQKTVRKTS